MSKVTWIFSLKNNQLVFSSEKAKKPFYVLGDMIWHLIWHVERDTISVGPSECHVDLAPKNEPTHQLFFLLKP
jgi:hypothetical protein